MSLIDLLTDYTLQNVALGAAILGAVSGVLGRFAVLRQPSLVRANIFQRKTRAAITILAVAIEVAAVLLIVGLTNGTLAEVAGRLEAVGADIIVQPQGSPPIIGLSRLTPRDASAARRLPLAAVAYDSTGRRPG